MKQKKKKKGIAFDTIQIIWSLIFTCGIQTSTLHDAIKKSLETKIRDSQDRHEKHGVRSFNNSNNQKRSLTM